MRPLLHGPTITHALLNGPEMLVFYGLLVAWMVAFWKLLVRPDSRHVTSKIGLSLSLIMGILAPLKYIWGVLLLNQPMHLSGSVDPMLYAGSFDIVCWSALIIGCTAAVTLMLSAWAWLLPGSSLPQTDGGRG
ncbi:hypothetical protein [Luteolibacter marinus]|uniref:hypothetical protein n=1 Tax=Luteolibacter marinus TaxID=2776705 RepID=UPI001868B3F5|nr:hypothetical protein [Luteolibacter marinus]